MCHQSKRNWKDIVFYATMVAFLAGISVSCYYVIDPLNHARDNYRFEFGTFVVVNYGNVWKGNRYESFHVATLNLRKVNNPNYECWLTTNIRDINTVTLAQSAELAYPRNLTLDVYYNPDGSSCGFDKSASISDVAGGIISLLVIVGTISVALFITCWECCHWSHKRQNVTIANHKIVSVARPDQVNFSREIEIATLSR